MVARRIPAVTGPERDNFATSEQQENTKAGNTSPPYFIGQSPCIRDVLSLVAQIADTDATVLITGESGTGKDLIAHALHRQSSRRNAAFIPVNCGAIAEMLEESELFGHIKGAFTGACSDKIGKFEAAHGGTVFLDEIDEMSKRLQGKLLRILQSGEYAPVGVAGNRYCNVRVIAATNQNLPGLVETGAFRKDLYYRLNIIRLELPPLRERKCDIPILAGYFVKLFQLLYHKANHSLELSPEAEEILLRYDFPGNVRELENIIRRAVILCRESHIHPRHLPAEILTARVTVPAHLHCTFHEAKAKTIEAFEKSYLIFVLNACGGIVIPAPPNNRA